MVVNRDRSRWEIILDVLKAIQEVSKAKKTRIMQKAYLDWRNFKRYFDFLLEEGFIECTQDVCYRLTEKGERLLARLQEVDEIAGSKWRV
jgi:predicted transcriptional regulator